MITEIRWLILAVLTIAAAQQTSEPTSPCPEIFKYEQRATEPGKWYGVINLTTDITLYSLWLNIVLDNKADIVGNWLGEVSTKDNMDFRIENTNIRISPGPPIPVRFFVQYNPGNVMPTLKYIRLNGKEICNTQKPQEQLALSITNPAMKPKDNVEDPLPAINVQQSTTTMKPNTPKTTERVDTTIKTDSNIELPIASTTTTRFGADTTNQVEINANNITDIGASSELDPKKNDIVAVVTPSSETIKPTNDLPETISIQSDTNVSNFQSQTVKPQADSSQNAGNDFLYQKPNTQDTSIQSIYDQYKTTTKSESNFGLTTSTTTRSPDDSDFEIDDKSTVNDDKDYDDYIGGIPTIYIPSSLNKGSYNRNKVQCGKVVFKSSPDSANQDGLVSLEGQFPWQIALYQNLRSGENKYVCGGTLVTHRHVVTAAHCVTRRASNMKVNQNTLTMYLGKTNLRTSVDGVQIKFVEKITIHPEYNATSLNKDIAILQLKEGVIYTDHVRPICLWPESLTDFRTVAGKQGSLVGWGFEVSGATKQELSLVRMPVVDSQTCAKSYSSFFAKIVTEYTYCAMYTEGTSICNSDSGGGMVFKSDDTWYLRGVASLSVAKEDQFRCDPSHFVIFTDVAKFLPWIKNNIYDY